MLNSFKDILTKVTDLTILFASIFTFLAFITPKEISIDPLERSRERASISQSELRDARNALSENEAMASTIQASINEFNQRLSGLDPTLDSAELQALLSQIDSAAINLEKEESEKKSFVERIEALEASINSERQKINNLENQLNSSKSISWIQPVRKNVEALANAAGMDGILAGFASLIFCLVCKRRKEWFKRIFRIFYK
ncbi:MAG TPA: hypothetical protein QF540_06070 [Gammaproteobacteria bacterium]|nr:hypothetical protein [Gammaproteobacteria bacterium]HJN01100.1 hypothetical protein [Gammaproteobacteria bacterium]|tara:strand:+ start:18097 stop:18696 length:600 start_codon:yes stop_codon:yes gene_type:complete